MQWIGLTGGIASGKSAIGKILQREGFAVVDADVLARTVVESGRPGHDQVVQEFGPSILKRDGSIDRTKLGSLVFADATLLKKLEGIIHPYVKKMVIEKKKILVNQGQSVSFYMVPLLFESGDQNSFDRIIVVSCSQAVQVERAMARDGLNEKEVLSRINRQMAVEDKVALADLVIENNGSLAELEEKVLQLINTMPMKYRI